MKRRNQAIVELSEADLAVLGGAGEGAEGVAEAPVATEA